MVVICRMMTSWNGSIFRVPGPLCGEFPHKGQYRGGFMCSLIWAWANGWVNHRDAGDLRRHRAHYNVTVMRTTTLSPLSSHCDEIYGYPIFKWVAWLGYTRDCHYNCSSNHYQRDMSRNIIVVAMYGNTRRVYGIIYKKADISRVYMELFTKQLLFITPGRRLWQMVCNRLCKQASVSTWWRDHTNLSILY